MQKNEIILYQPEGNIAIEVRLEDEMVWLNRQQLALLFGRDVKTIGKHVNNALKEELKGFSVVAKFATTARDGKTYNVDYYNLDMVLSVGYRVKSNRGVEFRRWANSVLKDYILRGYAVNQRIERLESAFRNTIGKSNSSSVPPCRPPRVFSSMARFLMHTSLFPTAQILP